MPSTVRSQAVQAPLAESQTRGVDELMDLLYACRHQRALLTAALLRRGRPADKELQVAGLVRVAPRDVVQSSVRRRSGRLWPRGAAECFGPPREPVTTAYAARHPSSGPITAATCGVTKATRLHHPAGGHPGPGHRAAAVPRRRQRPGRTRWQRRYAPCSASASPTWSATKVRPPTTTCRACVRRTRRAGPSSSTPVSGRTAHPAGAGRGTQLPSRGCWLTVRHETVRR
jgi:hypothetical protein